MRRLIALQFAILLASCSGGSAAAPDLPQSVTPSWTRKSVARTSDECWKAQYSSGGSAVVDVCRYRSDAIALDRVQRARPQANSVNFQQGKAFVTVTWTNVSQAEITSLVRAVQKNLSNN